MGGENLDFGKLRRGVGYIFLPRYVLWLNHAGLSIKNCTYCRFLGPLTSVKTYLNYRVSEIFAKFGSDLCGLRGMGDAGTI